MNSKRSRKRRLLPGRNVRVSIHTKKVDKNLGLAGGPGHANIRNRAFWQIFIEQIIEEKNHEALKKAIFDKTLSHTKDKVKTFGVDFDKLGKKVKLERGKHFRLFDPSTWINPFSTRIRTSYEGSVRRGFFGLLGLKRETSFDYKETLNNNIANLKAQIFAILDNDRQMSSIENCLRYNETDKQLLLMATERNCVDDRVHNDILRSFLGVYQFDELTPTESKLMTLLSFCLSVLDANDQITDQGTIKSGTDKDLNDLTGIAEDMKGLLKGEDATTITEMTIEKFKAKMNNCEALGEKVGYEKIKDQEKKILGDGVDRKVYSMFYQLRHEIDNIRSASNLGNARTTFDALFPIIDANNYPINQQGIWYKDMRKQLIYKRGIDKGIIYTEKNDKNGPLNISSASIIHAVLKSDDTFPRQEVTYVKNDDDKWTLGEVNDGEEWVAGDVIIDSLPENDFIFYATEKSPVAEVLRTAFQNSAISGVVKAKKRKHNLHFMIDGKLEIQPEQDQLRHRPLKLKPIQSRIKRPKSCLRRNDNPDKPEEERRVQFILPK